MVETRRSLALLLDEPARGRIDGWFGERAAAVDRGQAGVREGIDFVQREVLVDANGPRGANNDRLLVARAIATIAWSDMSTAFSLWAHRMVLGYLSLAPAGLQEQYLPPLLGGQRTGSTALAGAMAQFLGLGPVPVTAGRQGGLFRLEGRINWASNLFAPDFVMVTAVQLDGGTAIVALEGNDAGVQIDPYPQLLALQATASSSLRLAGVEIPEARLIAADAAVFIPVIRPPFLLFQAAFCWGLAARSLAEAGNALRGVNQQFEADHSALLDRLDRLAAKIERGLVDASVPSRDIVATRLEAALLAGAAVGLEARTAGGRGYVHDSPAARRLREAAFLPIQAPTEGQLRWELSRSA